MKHLPTIFVGVHGLKLGPTMSFLLLLNVGGIRVYDEGGGLRVGGDGEGEGRSSRVRLNRYLP